MDGDEIVELAVSQGNVRPVSDVRPSADAVLTGAGSECCIQGGAVHDTVAEGAELCSLHAQELDE